MIFSVQILVFIYLRSLLFIDGVQLTLPSSTQKDIEDAIKIRLKHAPDRMKEAVKKQRQQIL